MATSSAWTMTSLTWGQPGNPWSCPCYVLWPPVLGLLRGQQSVGCRGLCLVSAPASVRSVRLAGEAQWSRHGQRELVDKFGLLFTLVQRFRGTFYVPFLKDIPREWDIHSSALQVTTWVTQLYYQLCLLPCSTVCPSLLLPVATSPHKQ